MVIINYYKAVETLLYNYKVMHAEIKNIDLEIAELENEYKGCGAISYEEKVDPTNKFNSSVENEIIARRYKPEQLEKRKHKLEVQIKKIDNALEALEPREYEIITMKYFNRISNKNIAAKLNLTEQWVCSLNTIAINNIANLIYI